MTADRRYTLPARTEGFIARDLGDEIVILNPKTHAAHRLVGKDAQAWRHAGTTGGRDLAESARRLQEIGVLTGRAGTSRRTVLRGAVTVGGLAIAAPAIETIFAPSAM